MKTLVLPCLALSLCLLTASSAEEARPDRGQEARPGRNQERGFVRVPEAERIEREILGSWQLTTADIPDVAFTNSGLKGYMLVLPGYLSIEIHGHTSIGAFDTTGLFFQTGTHRWSVDELAQMHTDSLIGVHNMTEDEEVEFEAPGMRRKFQVTLENDLLILERRGQSRLMFQRLGKLPFPDRDPAYDKDEAKGKPRDGRKDG